MYTSDIEFALKNSNNLLFFRHICLIVAFLKAFLGIIANTRTEQFLKSCKPYSLEGFATQSFQNLS